MAKSEKDTSNGEPSGFDRVREEVVNYLGAQVERLAEKAGDTLSDVTGQLTDVAENGGTLPKAGARILQGDSPMKALVSEKAKSVKDSVVGKVKDTFGGGSGRKAGSTKVMNIIEVLDVGVPLRTAYDHWTEYEEFSGFTKGVRDVGQGDEVSTDWKVKVGPSTRSWKATVQEQVPDERIVWTSEGAKGTTRGVVSFHELAPTLTRIVLVVEYYPSGLFEKTGNLWRAQGRRLRLDFKNFQRYVTLGDEEAEGWRGEIRDGEVVKTHEEAMEEEQEEDEGGEGDEEDEDYQDDEDAEGAEDDAGEEDAEEDDGEEGEYEDDDAEAEEDYPDDEYEDDEEDQEEDDEADEDAEEYDDDREPARR